VGRAGPLGRPPPRSSGGIVLLSVMRSANANAWSLVHPKVPAAERGRGRRSAPALPHTLHTYLPWRGSPGMLS